MDKIVIVLAAPRDSPLQHLRQTLLYQGDVKLIAETGDVDTVRLVRAWRPDVLLLDGGAHGAGTIATLNRVRAIVPAMKTLVFCRVLSEQYLVRVLNHGACGCVLTGTPAQHVLAAIRAVHAGELWASRRTVAHAFHTLLAMHVRPSEQNVSPVQLSPRELQIVAWMRRGMSNKEIARELGISDTTVKTHAHNIFHKMSTSGRVRLLQKLQAGRGAIRAGNGKEKLHIHLRRQAPPALGAA
jgi:DNA-binding NarL/FixJ family response regulator